MLASLYNGNVHVWNYESQTLVKSFEVTDVPGNFQNGLAKWVQNFTSASPTPVEVLKWKWDWSPCIHGASRGRNIKEDNSDHACSASCALTGSVEIYFEAQCLQV